MSETDEKEAQAEETPKEESPKKEAPKEEFPYNPIIVFLTGLGVLVAVYFGIVQISQNKLSNKELLINLTVKSPLITKEITSDLDFSVNGIKANDVYYNEISMENTGGQSILKEDFYESNPISLYFGSSCNIVSLQTTSSPDNFKDRLEVKKVNNHIEILPTLINRGDTTTIKVVTANCNPNMIIKGSINGISKISENWTVSEPKNSIVGILILVIIIALILSGYLSEVLPRYLRYLVVIVFSAVSIILIINSNHSKSTFVNQIPSICKQFFSNLE